MTQATMNRDDFDYVCRLVFDRSAIVLDADKEYLVSSRLTPLARERGLDGLAGLVNALRLGRDRELSTLVVEAMTTNETSFFRDGRPFDALRDTVLPDVIERRSRTRSLNIWCAACSSGQEPYSIAMLLREDFPQLNDWNVRILGTDLSQEMVDRCKQGTYSQFEINRGLPARYLPRHFERAGASWSVMASTRRGLDFRTMNLIDPWPPLPAMDIVFIRNVLIYFDPATKRNLLERAHRALAPEGYLFLGGAETTINLHEGFERLPITLAGCYRKLDPALVGA